MARRRIRSFLVLVFLLALLPVGVAEARGLGCVGSKPTSKTTYTTERMVMKVTFTLKGCRREDGFGASFTFDHDAKYMSQDKVGFSGCFGERLTSCTMRFSLPHQVVEHAEYNLSLHYDTPRGSGIYLISETCTSTITSASCE